MLLMLTHARLIHATEMLKASITLAHLLIYSYVGGSTGVASQKLRKGESTLANETTAGEGEESAAGEGDAG